MSARIWDDDPEMRAHADAERGHYEANKPNGFAEWANSQKGRAELRNGASIKMRKIDWAWNGWLARGKLQILAGQKGAGKSTIVFDIFAQITCGGTFPDGSIAPLGDVLIWSGEDDIEDTIMPRLVAAGADPARVWFIDNVIVNGEKRAFRPANDLPILLERARELPELVAMLIDPVVSASAGDSHKNSETRIGLQPLVDFTVDRNIASLGITHFTKGTQGQNPIERVTGSLAFGAIPRVVWAAAKGDNENGPRRLVRIASNIGPSGGGYEYSLYQGPVPGEDLLAQRVEWGAYLDGSPIELLERKEDKAKKTQASELLDTLLADGPVAVTDIQDAARANGFSWPTVERAKKDAKNIVAKKASSLRKEGVDVPEPISGQAWCWHKTSPMAAAWGNA